MKKITLNGTELSASSGYMPSRNEYKIQNNSSDKNISFSTSAFSEDTNILVISADGYKDLTLKINKRGSKIIE